MTTFNRLLLRWYTSDRMSARAKGFLVKSRSPITSSTNKLFCPYAHLLDGKCRVPKPPLTLRINTVQQMKGLSSLPSIDDSSPFDNKAAMAYFVRLINSSRLIFSTFVNCAKKGICFDSRSSYEHISQKLLNSNYSYGLI
jgi:hypothetical protein